MICLKEAFRYQNYLSNLITTTLGNLMSPSFSMKTVATHMKSKANPDAEDEVIEGDGGSQIDATPDELLRFLEYLVDTKERLSDAISVAKRSTIDIDVGVANNKIRQQVAASLARLSNMRPSETVRRGSGYKFNANGDQVPYYYDIKEISTINFDRGVVKAAAKKMRQTADEASMKIDKALIDTQVDYDPIFCVTDSYQDSLDTFLHAPK